MNDPKQGLDVSRETLERLETYVALVQKWTPKINIISKSTVPAIWERHIADSIETVRSGPISSVDHWADFGSGGGFPGLVAAILARESNKNALFTLVESDQRKCAFLRTVARECDLNVQVKSQRIEHLEPLNAAVVSARALANLTDLLAFADRHLGAGGLCLFPKGITWEKELEEAQAMWRFDHEIAHSQTEPGSVVLKIKGVSRAE